MQPRITAALTATVMVAAGLLAASPSGANPASPRAARALTVGSVTTHRCNLAGRSVTSYCGSIQVPLNYNSARDGTITVGFGWFPATAKATTSAPAQTIVAEEGGPGYPATDSATDYVPMLGKSLLATHNLLLVDERGTGLSTLINCHTLQTLPTTTTTPALLRAIRHCGQSLNHRFPKSGGGFVHASDLFTTANSARDMARVLNALGIDKVDLYGDSYGTYFSQSFMSHFPHRLRSVTLDSAYEARNLDPSYHTTVTTARRAFDTVCRRSAACHAAAPGSSWHRIGRLARAIRAHPFSGRAPGVGAKPVTVRMNIGALVNLVNDAGYDFDPYRQLDAAARAYLHHGDARPLLRLYAQDLGYDLSNVPPAYYSDGQYYAIGCSDYPQLFNVRDPSKQRRRQFAAHVRHYPAHAFAPFTVREWVRVDPFTEPYHACTAWPRRVHRNDPPVVPHVSMNATHVPVLILNGELDSLTPAAGGAHIHRQIGTSSRHIVAANTVHLVGDEDRYGCGQSLVRHFIADPSGLKTLDDSCAAKIPTVRTVGNFPATVSHAQPAHGSGSRRLRQQASVALAAAGDAAIRYNYVNGNKDLGLRGGTVRYRPAKGNMFTAHLKKVRWTNDSVVSGRVTFSPHALTAFGSVTIKGAGRSVDCAIIWRGAKASVVANGIPLHAPAP